MFVRAYLRASTDEQDATRAREQLEAFASDHGLRIAAYYIVNASGAKLARPELFRLLSDARPGDVLLVEQVDRLSRLTASDWEKLKAELATRRVRVVALDLPTSWMMATGNGDDFTARMFDAINGMMLDVLAAVARKDYEDRRRRQAQGQTRAKAEGRYRGRHAASRCGFRQRGANRLKEANLIPDRAGEIGGRSEVERLCQEHNSIIEPPESFLLTLLRGLLGGSLLLKIEHPFDSRSHHLEAFGRGTLQCGYVVESGEHSPDDFVFLPEYGLRRSGVHLDLLTVTGRVLAQSALKALSDSNVIDD